MSTITTTNGKHRNILSGRDRFYLNRWIADNFKKIDGMGVEAAAQSVSRIVGFKVTPTNLRVARKSTGVEFKLKSEPVIQGAGAKQAAITNHMAAVAMALYDLYRAIGSDVPAELEATIRELRQH